MASRVQSDWSSDSDVLSQAFGTQNVAVGNLIALTTRNSASAESLGVTDNLGNVYARLFRVVGTGYTLEMWWAKVTVAGACTVSFSGTAGVHVQMEEVTGLGAGAVVHASTSASGTSTTPASGSVTTTVPTFLVSGLCLIDYPTVAVTQGAGWSIVLNAGNKYAMEDRNETSTGSFNGNWTLPESHEWIATVVAFSAGPPTMGYLKPNATRPAPFRPGLAR